MTGVQIYHGDTESQSDRIEILCASVATVASVVKGSSEELSDP